MGLPTSEEMQQHEVLKKIMAKVCGRDWVPPCFVFVLSLQLWATLLDLCARALHIWRSNSGVDFALMRRHIQYITV